MTVKSGNDTTEGVAIALAMICFAVVCPIFLKLHSSLRYGRKSLPLPPGPRGWPIIGNIFDIPENDMQQWATEQAKVYGENIRASLSYFWKH